MRFFDRLAPRYDATIAPDARATAADLAPVVARIAALANGRGDGSAPVVADIGCGTGRAWPHLIGAGVCVVALDASAPMLAIARRRASAAFVRTLRADLYAPWPIADRSVDAVVALHAVLAHPPGDAIAQWGAVGREIRRAVRRGGLVAIDFPEPAWARAHLLALGGDRYLATRPARDHGATADGDAIVAVIPDPQVVLSALGLTLAFGPCTNGVRAMGLVADA